MPILDLQRRLREIGRIRLGQQVPTSSGKTRPEKLDRFRVTSASQTIVQRVAALYGGEAHKWNNNGSAQWEVITEAARLPVLVPPQPISQYYELWSGGGCQRRCDGVTELLKDKPCICGPDPAERKCKPTTRLNVVLRDVEGLGVFRLESHGYYSAIELPDLAEFLARTGGYVEAWLSLEERTAIRDGKTRRWMVPTLEVDVTPAALLAGGAVPVKEIGSAPAALPASGPDPWAEWTRHIKAAPSLEELHKLWQARPSEDIPQAAEAVLKSRAEQLRLAEEQQAAAAPAAGSVDALWMQVLAAAPETWSTAEVEAHFKQVTGIDPAAATAEDIRRYLDTAYPTKTGDES